MKLGAIMSLMKKWKINMLKRILLYFLLAFCILSKDGITWIIDSIQVKQSAFNLMEKTADNAAEEEDTTEDIWHFASTGIENLSFVSIDCTKQILPNTFKENLLQVHLERIIPPPDKAWFFALLKQNHKTFLQSMPSA